MTSMRRRQPVPARGEPTPAAIEAIEQTPPAPENITPGPPAPPEPEPDTSAEQSDDGAPDHAGSDNGSQAVDGDTDDSAVLGATEARALIDFGDYRINDLVTGTPAEIEAMMLAGNADPHPDAVAYARSLLA